MFLLYYNLSCLWDIIYYLSSLILQFNSTNAIPFTGEQRCSNKCEMVGAKDIVKVEDCVTRRWETIWYLILDYELDKCQIVPLKETLVISQLGEAGSRARSYKGSKGIWLYGESYKELFMVGGGILREYLKTVMLDSQLCQQLTTTISKLSGESQSIIEVIYPFLPFSFLLFLLECLTNAKHPMCFIKPEGITVRQVVKQWY